MNNLGNKIIGSNIPSRGLIYESIPDFYNGILYYSYLMKYPIDVTTGYHRKIYQSGAFLFNDSTFYITIQNIRNDYPVDINILPAFDNETFTDTNIISPLPIGGNHLKLSWTNDATADLKSIFVYWDSGNPALELSAFSLLDTINPDSTGWESQALDDGATYRFFLKRSDLTGNISIASNIASIKVIGLPYSPESVEYLYSNYVLSILITEAEDKTEDNTAGYLIFSNLCPELSILNTEVDYSKPLTFIAGTDFTFPYLFFMPGNWIISVVGVNKYGMISKEKTVKFYIDSTFIMADPLPKSPYDLTGKALAGGMAQLKWKSFDYNISKFNIYYSLDNGSNWLLDGSLSISQTINIKTNYYTTTAIKSGAVGSVLFKVRSLNSDNAEESNEKTFSLYLDGLSPDPLAISGEVTY